MEFQQSLRYSLISASIAILAACSSADSGTSSTSSTETVITGSIFAAPVSDAIVWVKDMAGNEIAGPVTTASDGTFSVTIQNTDLASDLVFESTGGSFVDEAKGVPVDAQTMAVITEAGTLSSANNSVHATPGSTIVHDMVRDGMSMTDAKDVFANAFGYAPSHDIAPTNATSPVAGAAESELLAGLRAAAFSQLAADLNLEPAAQFDLFKALARDLSDHALDGKAGAANVSVTGTSTSLPEDIQNRFTTALLNFHDSGLMGDVHGNDQTGLTNDKLGILPFAKVALTTRYRVEYMPTSMMDAVAGKSTFNIHVTDGVGDDVLGATVDITPMMNMATHMHSTPVGTITELGNGLYEVNVYYVMASVMNSISMGYWDLKLSVNGEEAHFYPPVMMAMGDTLLTKLKGQNPGDTVFNAMLNTVEGRTYFLFNDGLTGSGSNYTFGLFIATRDTMMDFPAVDAGVELQTDTGPWILSTVQVQVSTDGSTYTNASSTAGTGYFSKSGLDVSDGKIYARLTIDGVLKTTNGLTADPGVNDFATFTVTLP